jgi:hypothetical protein
MVAVAYHLMLRCSYWSAASWLQLQLQLQLTVPCPCGGCCRLRSSYVQQNMRTARVLRGSVCLMQSRPGGSGSWSPPGAAAGGDEGAGGRPGAVITRH